MTAQKYAYPVSYVLGNFQPLRSDSNNLMIFLKFKKNNYYIKVSVNLLWNTPSEEEALWH